MTTTEETTTIEPPVTEEFDVLIVGAEVELAIINSKGEVKKIPEELLKKI